MPTTTTCPDPRSLQAMVSGSLPPEQCDALLDHVETCPACLETIQQLASTDTVHDAIRQAAPGAADPDDSAVQKIVQRLADRAMVSTTASGQRAPVDHTDLSSLGPPLAPDEIGRLGELRILSKLGAGGMGIVFLAEDPRLKRQVAVKVLNPALAVNDSSRKRFLREAQAAAALDHDHIVAIHHVAEERGIPFLVMPVLKGESLESRLRNGRIEWTEAVEIARQVAQGLVAAHQVGLIHRDIKPANLWLESTGRVKILDFGLARAADSGDNLSQTGLVVGTPAYMAPEQARGQTVDARADLFSLGCVLYEMATGRRPFSGPNQMAILSSLALDTPVAPSLINFEIPTRLSDLIMQLLEKDPAQRPASAAEVIQKLHEVEIEPTIELPSRPEPRRVAVLPGRRFRWLAGAAVLVAVIGVFSYLYGGTLIRVATNKGVLVIEYDGDRDLEVTITQEQVELHQKSKDRRFVLSAGEYDVDVREKGEGGISFGTRRFTITRNRKETFAAWAEPPSFTLPEAPLAFPRRNGDYALRFEGTGRVNLPTKLLIPKLAAADEYTLEGFVMPMADEPKELTDFPSVVSTHFQSAITFYKPNRFPGNWKFAVMGSHHHLVGLGPWVNNRRIHVAAVQTKEEMRFFVDGIKTQTLRIKDFKLGQGRGASIGDFFNGVIDEVRISSKARYENNFVPAPLHEADSDTIALYHFDEGQGDLLQDSSVNGIHGAIIGAKWVNADGSEIKETPLPRLIGHTGVVRSLAVSKDGQFALTGSGTSDFGGARKKPTDDCSVRLWDLKTGLELKRLGDFDRAMFEVGFSSDGRRAFAAGHGIVVWDLTTHQEIYSLEKSAIITLAALSPDDQHLFFSDTRGNVKICDFKTGKEVRRLDPTPFQWTSGGAFHPSGTLLLESGSLDQPADRVGDYNLRLWDVIEGKKLREFKGHTKQVVSIAFSPDGRRALSGGWDRVLRLWDVEKGTELRQLVGHDHLVSSIAFINSTRAVSGSHDGTVRVWDVETGQQVQRFDFDGNYIHAVAVAPYGQRVLAAAGPTVHIRDLPRSPVKAPTAGDDRSVAEWIILSLQRKVHVNDSNQEITDVQALPTQPFRLTGAYLWYDDYVTDDHLANLRGLQRLRILSLRQTKVTDKGVKYLLDLPALHRLDLAYLPGVTDAGVELLKKLPRLRYIKLGPNISNKSLEHLATMRDLQAIELYDATLVTDAGVTHLRNLPELTYLSLLGTSITDKGLAHVAVLSRIRNLTLDGTKITNKGLSELAALERIENLSLKRTSITDAGLPALKKIRTLTGLELTDTQVSPEGRAELRKALPKCKILPEP